MMPIKRWQIVIFAILLLIAVLAVAVMKAPLRLFFAEDMTTWGVTDLDGSSLSRGHLWVANPSLPGLVEVNYHWCPASGLRSWCVDIENELIAMNAVLTPGADNLRLAEGNIRKLSSQILPSMSLVDLTLNGDIDELVISSYQCPMQHIDLLSAQLVISRMSVFGTSLGEHRVATRSLSAGIEINISGAALDGGVMLTNGAYEASGELVASRELEGMARSFMRSLGGNRYGWEIKGKIPC